MADDRDDDFQDQMNEGTLDEGQGTLFDRGKWYDNHWKGMPEYEHEDQTPFRSLFVHFANQQDFDEFMALLDQPATEKTKYVWYPELKHATFMNKRWIGSNGTEGHEHEWSRIEGFGDANRRYLCTVEGCGIEREGDPIETPALEDLAVAPDEEIKL